MPRYGAKTYSGKQQRKDDMNSQFDEIWAKSQGSKQSSHQFTPVKDSPAGTRASRSKPQEGAGVERHYQTRSSPVKAQPETQSSPVKAQPGSRRTRSNSSAEDPFSFGKEDDDLAKSPVRKSPRTSNNGPSLDAKETSGIIDRGKSLSAKPKPSASNSKDTADSNGRKQSTILKYTTKLPTTSVKVTSVSSTTNGPMDKLGATPTMGTNNNSELNTGLFTDGFGSPPAVTSSRGNRSSEGKLSEGIGSPPLKETSHNGAHEITGQHSTIHPENRLPNKRTLPNNTDDEVESRFVIKRKFRTNGDVAELAEPLKTRPKDHLGAKPGVKSQAASNNLPKTTDDAGKDEFDFEFSDGSRESSPVVDGKTSSVASGLIKKRSKEITGITRRIFNSPKKSPMKARYNARAWTKSESEEIDQDSLLDEEYSESQSQASTSSSTSQQPSVAKPPPLTRTVKQKPNHSTVTSLKCKKQDKKFFTVVKHVKQAHQCQESGESQQFSDDIEYLLDGLNSNAGSSTKCLSTISLIEKSTVPSFRMHLRAHNTISRIFTALKDAANHPCMALCTSGLMFMLSKDRLNMDLDRSSLTLLVRLLSVEGDGATQQEQEEYVKTRARLWGIVKSIPGQMFGVTEETLSSGFFAMESLLALTSKRSGEWFKEELRFAGGLENMANTVAKVTEEVAAAHTDSAQIELVPLRTLNRCVRVLENVTFMNTDNQQYLLELSDLKLIRALSGFLTLCEKHVEFCSTDSEDPDSQEANLSKLVIQGLLANLRLLLNLTHDNEWGSMKIGEQSGLMYTVLQCVLQLPQFIPKDQRFDLLVLSLGLLINLVEHNVTNARILTMMKTNHSYDSQPDTDQDEVSSISALTELFLQRHQAAVKLENKTEHDEEDDEEIPQDTDIDDWVTIETGPNNSGADQPTQEEIKQTIRRALHTAGRHMEDSIVASYAALLLGCLLRENKLNVKKVRDCLPGGDFTVMVNMLKKLLSFMEITDADGTTGQRSISKVIEVLECC